MSDRLHELLEAYLEQRLSDRELGELRELLRGSSDARQAFWEYVEQHALLEDVLAEGRGRDLALAEQATPAAIMTSTTVNAAPSSQGRHWTWAGVLTVLAASLLLALRPWWHAAEDPPVVSQPASFATVRALAGDVQTTDATGHWVAVQANASIATGQALRVGDEDSFAELRLTDGTLIVLASGTNVRFPTAGTHLHVEKGAVQVQTAAPATTALMVTTDHARVTGTERFRVYRELHASRVESEQGKVRLDRQQGGATVELSEGHFVIATEEAQPMLPRTLPLGHATLRHTFRHGGNAVAFATDGTRLAAHHHGRGWKAWQTDDGKLTASAPGSGQWTAGMAFTPLQDAVLGLGNGGAAQLWNIGEPLALESRLREKDLRDGAVSRDGRWLAQATRKGEVAVWEVDAHSGNSSLRRSLAVQPSRLALASHGPHVAVGQWAGDIRIFEVMTGREVTRYKLKRTPTPLALAADNRYVAAYANSDGLVLFEQQTGKRSELWPGEGARVGCLDFAADGRVLFAGLEDGTVRAWSTVDGASLLVLDTGHRSVNRVTASVDRTLLATVGDSDCVKIWECRLP